MKFGTVDGNRTRRVLIDSQVSPPGGLYGIKTHISFLLRLTHLSSGMLGLVPRMFLSLAGTTGLEPAVVS